MKRLLYSLLIVAAVIAVCRPAFAQTLTGTIAGTIKDEQGGALPGASVTLVGKTGSKTATADADGNYRFLALDPGTYSVEAQLAGFQSKRQQTVTVNVNKQATIDLTLAVSGVAETVEVVGEAPVVDTTSSATDSSLSQDLLFNLPIRPQNAATDLLNFAPGINEGSAYGSDGDTANGLLLDGVDTRDPEGGSAWTFFNYNIVEEVQIQGLGATAEYGAFTGAIVNTITRSGGNQWGGLFDVIYTKGSLSSNNVPARFIEQNPSLGQAASVKKFLDFTTQFSGPIVQNKLFFFASAQRFERNEDPAGPRTRRDEVSPRINVKLNYNPGSNDQFQATMQYDSYNIIGRPPGGIGNVVTDDITNREDAPEWVWGAQWRHLFGSRTFSEIKFTGWTGFFDLNPENRVPGRFDGESQLYSQSQGWFAYFDRGRNQVNASISHHAEGWGQHDLKFGVEVERSRVRNRYGYVGDIFYYDYGGAPYYGYDYGYDLHTRNQRESVFLQDSWKLNNRLTINPGVRLDFVRGYPNEGDKVYDTKNLAPRLGFAFDVTGDNKTVLKGSYSRYYEGSFSLAYSSATPGIEDFVLYDLTACPSISEPCPRSLWQEIDRSPGRLYRVDPDIKHPRVDEITVGLERALTNDVRLQVTGVKRDDKNMQGSVLPSARWSPSTFDNEFTGLPLGIYQWANPDESESDLFITNPDGFQYLSPTGEVLGTAVAERRYRGLIFVLDKRFSNRWLGRVSYVLSETKGTVSNDGFDSYGADADFETPNRALVNADGSLENDVRHELKVLLGYEVPVIDLSVNAYWRSIDGGTFTVFQQVSNSTVNGFPTSLGRRIRLQPRGSSKFERRNQLDLRLEKIFKFGDRKDRLSVYGDITNVFNNDTVFNVQNRFPSVAVAGAGDVEALSPSALIAPRQLQLGVRWSF